MKKYFLDIDKVIIPKGFFETVNNVPSGATMKNTIR